MASTVGPDFVALQVRDLGVSRRFYEQELGLEVDPQSLPNAVVFRTEPIPFAVRKPMVDLDATDGLGRGVSLWFCCDDAQGLYETLVVAGIQVAQEPFDGPFGRTFSFADPDGYTVTVHDG